MKTKLKILAPIFSLKSYQLRSYLLFIKISTLFCALLINHLSIGQELVTEISSFEDRLGGRPYYFTPFNDVILFRAFTDQEGSELWQTDGSTEGTTLLKDIEPGEKSASPKLGDFSILLNGELYFIANDQNYGTQLWKTDGTSDGTVRITSCLSGELYPLRLVDNEIFFLERANSESVNVWKSDGTEEGSVLVMEEITLYDDPDNFFVANGLFFFTLKTSNDNKFRVWRSDGTEAGTFPVSPEIENHIVTVGGAFPISQFFVFQEELFFVGTSLQFFGNPNCTGLIKTDGSVDGTIPLVSFPQNICADLVNFGDVMEHNGKMFFSFYYDDSNRLQIFVYDNQTEQLEEILDQNYPGFFIPARFLLKDDDLYFTAGNDDMGTSLMSLNIQNQQLTEVQTLRGEMEEPFFFSEFDVATIYANNDILFIDLPTSNRLRSEVFVGNPSDTILLVEDISLWDGGLTWNGNFYFPGRRGQIGIELWYSDGTSNEVELVKNIDGQTKGVTFDTKLFPLNNRLVFEAGHPDYGFELWFTEGSLESTDLLLDIFPGSTSSAPLSPKCMTMVEDNLFFTAKTDTTGFELWISDGTLANTNQIKDISEGIANSIIYECNAVNEQLLFTLFDGQDDNELYRSDGTENGTLPIIGFGFNNFNNALNVEATQATEDKLFLVVTNQGNDLWVSDGTTDGTLKLMDFSEITGLEAVDNILYFKARVPDETTFGLWKSDGTISGTSEILINEARNPRFLTAFNQKLAFIAYTDETGYELWTTDGTQNGTALVKDIYPGLKDGIRVNNFVVYNNELFFSASDGLNGFELWKSDGTPQGTYMVRDIAEGIESSSPDQFKVVQDQLLFRAYHPNHGKEIWHSLGAENNTTLLADIVSGPISSDPTQFTTIDDKLYFTAHTNSIGRQIWTFDLTTSTEHIEFDPTSVVIFPNPTQNIVNIKFNEKRSANSYFELYNSIGQLVFNTKLVSDQQIYQFSLPKLNNGLYLYKIRNRFSNLNHSGLLNIIH